MRLGRLSADADYCILRGDSESLDPEPPLGSYRSEGLLRFIESDSGFCGYAFATTGSWTPIAARSQGLAGVALMIVGRCWVDVDVG